MSKINKIRLSGTDYDIQDVSATSVVEVTQQQYDDLPASAKTDNILYIITDSTVDYVTSAQTQYAITQAVSGKVDTSTYAAYTAATDTALANKQTTLTAGTGIAITNNVISTTGGGNSVVELTQAAYDALVTGGTVDPDTFYIITDAQAGDLTNYYTKTEVDTALGGKQDILTGGDGIDINNDVISVTGKADTSAVTAIQDSLSGYVTTDTDQVVTSRKTFTNSDKAIEFKQVDDNSKVGFKVKNSASTNNEVASFELRPNTFTVDGVQHPLLYFGHYRSTKIANAGVPQTVIGFRQYDQPHAAAYHYLIPLPEKAKTPFSLTTTFKNYFAPLGFKVNAGGTIVTTDETGVVDLSSYIGGGGSSINVVQTTGSSTTDVMSQDAVTTQLNNKANKSAAVGGYNFGSVNNTNYLRYKNVDGYNAGNEIYYPKINGKGILTNNSTFAQNNYNFQLVETSAITTSITTASTDSQVPSAKAVNDKLGGLSLVKLTQAEYDALSPNYDSNTLYVING